MTEFKVKYHAATYSGFRTVNAEDEEEAKAKVRTDIRKEMTLPMYSDSYRVVSSQEDEQDEEDDN